MKIDAGRQSWSVESKLAPSTVLLYTTPAKRVAIMLRRVWRPAVAGVILCLACSIPLLARNKMLTYDITQKGQAFNPGVLSINRGDTVQIINDDGDLIHHAYVDSTTFSFDSGDQEPGSKTDIVFSVPGTFVVLCGIHPKMRLDVVVK